MHIMGVPNCTEYWLNIYKYFGRWEENRAGNECNIFRDNYVSDILEKLLLLLLLLLLL